MKYIDYVFYRIAKAYKRWDGNDNTTAKTLVGFMLATSACDIILFPLVFFYGRDMLLPYRGQIKILAIIILVVFMFLIYTRYKKDNYDSFHAKWGNEEKWLSFYRGILVIIVLFTPLALLILGASIGDEIF